MEWKSKKKIQKAANRKGIVMIKLEGSKCSEGKKFERLEVVLKKRNHCLLRKKKKGVENKGDHLRGGSMQKKKIKVQIGEASRRAKEVL